MMLSLLRQAVWQKLLVVFFFVLLLIELLFFVQLLPPLSLRLALVFLCLWLFQAAIVWILFLQLQTLNHRLETQASEQAMANQLLERHRAELAKALQDIQVVSEIGRKITASLSLDKALHTIAAYFDRRLPYDVLAIVQYDMFRSSFDVGCHLLPGGASLPLASWIIEDVCAYSLRYKRTVQTWDFQEEGGEYIESPVETPIRSLICVPLISASIKLGCLYVASCQKDAYTTEEVDFLESIGGYLAIAMENAQVYARVEKQSEQIKLKNKRITESINYASYIQQSILPKEQEIRVAFPDSFVIYEPKDMVSGDFYWFQQIGSKQILAVGDCTGHGVPGAFMSLIGVNLLNEIVLGRGIVDPDSILAELHKGIQRLMKQNETKIQDGMDAGICTIDLRTKIMKFAGARMPLIYIQQGQMYEIKGGKKPIGGIWTVGEDPEAFHRRFVNLSIPTVFYLFSDGYPDQFGGPEGRKFMRKRLQRLLMDIHRLSMKQQKEILIDTLNNWRYGENYFHKQVDDILFMGVRLHLF
jgi:serine phosphatase RsbU (regulator of sigma subunit)